MKKLTSQVIEAGQVNAGLLDAMFNLMDQTYSGVAVDKIKSDLLNKHYVLLLSDDVGQLQGFTTMQVFDSYFRGNAVKIIYSGDTVISLKFRGELELMRAWWQLMDMIQQQYGDKEVYWMLISKGWRTYKFLPLFFKEFYPSRLCVTPADFQEFIDRLGSVKFPQEYKQGLMVPLSPDYLKTGQCDVPESRQDDADVLFFLKENPDFYKGTELVCITKVHSANLTRSGARLTHGAKN